MQQTVQLGNIQWIHLAQPDSEVIHQLAKEEGLHEILVDDLLEINSHSKIDSNSDNIFVALTFTRYLPEEQRYILKEIDAIIKENSIITTCALESDVINELLETLPKEFTHHTTPAYKNSPYYVLYKIIDAFYDKTIRSLENSSRTLLHIQESIAIKKAENEVVEELMNHNLNKITLKHNFLSQEDIIDELMTHVADHHEKHLRVYFNSLKVKLSKINSTINVLTEKTEGLLNAYNTFVGIKNNNSVTRLTFVNAIFMPLTLIAGIGGMSERSMMTGPENWKIAYPLFFVLCGVVARTTYILLKKSFLKK